MSDTTDTTGPGPETITTAAELDALPVGSVVLDRHGDVWQKSDDTGRTDEDGERLHTAWASAGVWMSDRTAREMFEGGPENFSNHGRLGPLTLLYRPDRPSESDAVASAAETIKATGGAVEIAGVRIEPCDTYGATDTTRALATLRSGIEALADEWEAQRDYCATDAPGYALLLRDHASALRALLSEVSA